MRFYWLRRVEHPRYSGGYDDEHKWGLPGIHCPLCQAIWSTAGLAFPSVDLSHVPEQEKYSARLEEDYSEFERLREQVRPLAPSGVQLQPGIKFGPLVGAARGEFGPLCLQISWMLLIRPEPLARLTIEGLQGLKGCRTEMRFRGKNPPALLELELLPRGRLHPDCLPADRLPPCTKCGRFGVKRPDEPILDTATLPSHLDLFRMEDLVTMIIATERFVEAVRRLGYEQDILFRELPLR
ncbi:double-CXXCG motif protein [Hyalangium rubrum]|uniref:Double-CXXCG motif protein n=1 Tax=Hyalangium rubrum TaxID=3103134 RepID=A0ABU5GYW0_9BACT|nr:double-CXXCG motif protein [Hyalangium sp. s54d21]MDY7225703.1 double-CXXCG motif protein [Hyalangium sp. s54d21]